MRKAASDRADAFDTAVALEMCLLTHAVLTGRRDPADADAYASVRALGILHQQSAPVSIECYAYCASSGMVPTRSSSASLTRHAAAQQPRRSPPAASGSAAILDHRLLPHSHHSPPRFRREAPCTATETLTSHRSRELGVSA